MRVSVMRPSEEGCGAPAKATEVLRCRELTRRATCGLMHRKQRQEAVAPALHLAKWVQREDIEAMTSLVVTIAA